MMNKDLDAIVQENKDLINKRIQEINEADLKAQEETKEEAIARMQKQRDAKHGVEEETLSDDTEIEEESSNTGPDVENGDPIRDEKGRILPGCTLNPNGRPKKECSLTNMMREHLNNIPKGERKTNKQILVEKVFKLAVKGDISAIKLMWNYLEGMPKQSVEVGTPISQNSILAALTNLNPNPSEESTE
jgi:hypothetical protein